MLVLVGATAASAGPWPREGGTWFVALSFDRVHRPVAVRGPAALYAEYGMPGRRVLAFAIEEGPGARRADLLLRWHPADLPGGLALGLTGGLRLSPRDPVRWRAIGGAEAGRGHDTAIGSLWLRTGVRVLVGRTQGGWQADLDLSAQMGLRRGAWIGMVGLTHYRAPGQRQTRLRPALGYEVHSRLTLLGEAAVARGGGIDSLRLSVWSRF